MRLTTSALRRVLTNQAGFVAAARSGASNSPQYGNPQRKWIEAAIREYFRLGKDIPALWAMFNQKVQQRPTTPRRAANAAGAVPLLDQFIAWDSTDPDLPGDAFPPTKDVTVGTHSIAVRRDLIYVDGGGYRVRQLWTDHQLRPGHPAAIQMAAAVLLSVDADLGNGSTTRVDVWGLRNRAQSSWDRGQLMAETTNLRDRLDIVEQAIQAP